LVILQKRKTRNVSRIEGSQPPKTRRILEQTTARRKADYQIADSIPPQNAWPSSTIGATCHAGDRFAEALY